MKVRVIGKPGRTPHLSLIHEGVTAKIYTTNRRAKNGQLYTEHTLVYHEAGRRTRRVFADLSDAKREAEVVLSKIANGQIAVLSLTTTDRENYVHAMEELEGTGVPLLAAVREYRAAHDLLGGKGTLNEAVRHFLAAGTPEIVVKPVGEVVAELLEAKRDDGVSEVYLTDLELRLRRFAESFRRPIGEIPTRDIEDWLRGLSTGARNRNNFAAVITTLFSFAKRAGYLPRDRATAADLLTRAKVKAKDIQIFTVEETRCLLNRLRTFRPDLLPFAAIGAFAGLRTAEISRLEWSDIRWDQGHIIVSADKAKTAQRRLVPIQPNLAKWLEPYRTATGKVSPFKRSNFAIVREVEQVVRHSEGTGELQSLEWKRNALRHSYGSYRLPIVKSAAELALEMGNSPRMIFQHYRELVTPADAAAYWQIQPPTRTSVGRSRPKK